MSVTYKDINQLSQKSSVAGTEKLPVSDTEFITPSQIVSGKVSGNGVENIVTLTASQYDALQTKSPNTAYIVTDRDIMPDGGTYLKYQLCTDEAAYNAITTKDGGTLYLIPVASL